MSFRRLAAFSLFVLGCESVQAPQLIELDSVAPLEVETGSQLTLTGGGFPAGHSAHVRFVGTIYRPGTQSESNVEVDAEGVAPESHHLNVPMSDRLAERFCGVGPESVHATFRGSVVASFSPLATGSPPISAALGNVTLDIQPLARSAARARDRIERARALLTYWGIEGEPTAMGSGGIEVKSIRDGSPAARILNRGDVIVAVDGVRTASVSDVAPTGEQARLIVRRGSYELERELPTREFEPLPFRKHGAALAFLAALLLATLAFVTFNASRRAVRGEARLRPIDKPLLALSGSALAIVPLLDNAWGLDADVTSVFGWLLALTVANGSASHSRIRTFADTFLSLVPLGIALLATSVTTGAWRLEELVRTQAPLPVDWFAFRGPGMLGLAACACFALARAKVSPPVRVQLAGVIVLTFFGGWLSPFGSSAHHPSTGLLVAGIVTFLAKSAALAWGTALPMPWLTKMGNRLRGTAYTLAAGLCALLSLQAQAPLYFRTFLASASLLLVVAIGAAHRLPQRTIRANALL